VVAVVFGTGLQAGQVGAGTRLTVALTPADFAADNRRQMLTPSEPNLRIAGPIIQTPKLDSGGRALMRAISSRSTLCSC